MKNIFTVIIFSLFLLSTFFLEAQITPGTPWTWIKGDNTLNPPGVYGIQGTADVLNKPGARESRAKWTDASGNFWLFGGIANATGSSNFFNDLWKYNPVNNEWTWIKGDNIPNQLSVYGTKGMPDAGNKPGGRFESVTWTDALGNFWLLGGDGYDATSQNLLNDLWKYTISTNEWTWVSGDNIGNQVGVYGTKGMPAAGNKPGKRFAGATWTDASGNLWLFGGREPQYLNDLWKYDVTANQWTWVNGDNISNQQGVYGTMGIANASNKPGAREACISWKDSFGNFWLFGGFGFDSDATLGYLNDLWKYDPVSNEWTWVNGDNTHGHQGIYGTQGIPASTNKPGSRYRSAASTDATGNFWLFGGNGAAAVGDGLLNDLWKYSTSTNEWTWVKGDNSILQLGIYGTMGVPDPSNKPGARQLGLSWTDAAGNLYLFGGSGGDLASGFGQLNDLWRLGTNSVVPVTILNISAQVVQRNVQVNWQTSQEVNTSNFIIERSSDGQNFSPIGSVIAAGNSSVLKKYSFTDPEPLQGTNYYRVQLADIDGHVKYSSAVRLNTDILSTIVVFPNPVLSVATINLAANADAELRVSLYDYKGALVAKRQIFLLAGINSFSVDMSKLSTGIYRAVLSWGNEIKDLRIMKK